MIEEARRIPVGVDLTRASAARVYDYLLGGGHNFAVDRELARQALAALPSIRDIAIANRTFLHRVVRECVQAGVTQFLDLGSGIPGVGNVHEVARSVDPECRVVYVDIDPVAHAHGQLILSGLDRTAIVNADLLDPRSVLGHESVRGLLDFDRPIVVLVLLVLQFVPDHRNPIGVLGQYRDVLAPGSMLALTHPAPEDGTEGLDKAVTMFSDRLGDVRPRGYSQFAPMFSGFELLDPGITPVAQWRPDHGMHLDAPVLGGLGVKR